MIDSDWSPIAFPFPGASYKTKLSVDPFPSGYFPPSRVSFGEKFVRALVSLKFQQTRYQKKA